MELTNEEIRKKISHTKIQPISDHLSDTETQPPTNHSLKTFTETISFYIKFFVPIFIFVLLLLDYLTFTQIFNFEPATFFDVYLYDVNISNSPLLLIVGFFPLVGVLLIYMISYLTALISINAVKFEIPIFSKLKLFLKKVLNRAVWLDILIIPLIFVLLLTISSYVMTSILETLRIENLIYLLTSFFIPLLIGHLGTIEFLKYYKNSERYTFVSIGLFVVTIVYIILFAFLLITNNQKTLALYLYLLLFPTLFSFQIIDAMIDDKQNTKNKSISPQKAMVVLIVLTIAMILGTTFLYQENKSQWTNKNKKQTMTMTMNLFLNKNFLSTNTELIDLNCSNYRGKDWNQSIQHIALDQNAMYLPISKEMKLYFTDINNTKKTKIYAVQKQFYKGETYFKLYGIGDFKENE